MRPNIVFVFSDQMRGMDLGCAGNEDVLTPNLDRMAAQGTRFDRAYANCPVCTPSRAMLLTGRYPLSNRVVANDLPLPEDIPTVGKALRDAGYRTGYVGKWHLDGVPRDKFTPPGPRRQGFDYWAAYNCSHDYFRAHKYFTDAPEPVEVDGYEPVVQTDLALDFIAEPDERPFCLFLSWGPPHDPYHLVPDEYKKLYDPEQVQLRPNFAAIPPGPTSLARDLDPRTTLAHYYAAITALDDQLGRIMAHLDTRGLAENTILVYTSDHGDMLWSQGRMKKQQPWEESIRIPFLVRWPGRVPAGHANGSLLSVADLAPTLLGLAGVDQLPGGQGTDLSPVVLGLETTGPDSGGPGSVFLMDLVSVDESQRQGIPEWRGVRTERHTYARDRGGGWLLYDNVEDPYQLENRIADPAYADVRGRLEDELSAWLHRVGDPFAAGSEVVRDLGLIDLWNARERELHPDEPRLL